MFCMNCGKALPDHAKFCKFCGSEQTDYPETYIPQQPLPPQAGTVRRTVTPGAPVTLGTPGAPVSAPLQTPGDGADSGQQTVMTQPAVPPVLGGGYTAQPAEPMKSDQPDPQRPHGPEPMKPYVPEIAPKPLPQDADGVVFRSGYARNMQKLMQIGVEMSGIAIAFLFIRLILSGFVKRSEMDGRAGVYLAFLALLLLLATCVVNGEKNSKLWLGLLPILCLLGDRFIDMADLNDVYPSEEFGYNVGWDKHGFVIIMLLVYLAAYVLVLLKKKEENRLPAGILMVVFTIGGIIFLANTASTAKEDILAGGGAAVWYDLFTGLELICFHLTYVCISIRELLAEREGTDK